LIPIEVSDNDGDGPIIAKNSIESLHEIDDISETSANPITRPYRQVTVLGKKPKEDGQDNDYCVYFLMESNRGIVLELVMLLYCM